MTQPATAGPAATTERLRRWAVDPEQGARIFRWTEPGAVERASAFYAGKIPATALGRWVDDLYALATGR